MNNLSRENQVNNIVKKVDSILYQLKLCNHLFIRSVRQLLVTALIVPHFDYYSILFSDIAGVLNLLRLQRFMNSCVRFIFQLRYDVHISPYYAELRWLKTDNRRKYFIGCLMYSILYTYKPRLFFKELQRRDNITLRHTYFSTGGNLA